MKLKKRKHVETDSDERLYLATWLMMDVTASIANAIDAKGLQQKDIAKRLGTTSQNISQMLEGGRNLTLRSAADLAWAVNCAVRVTLQPLGEFDAQTAAPSLPAAIVLLGDFSRRLDRTSQAPRMDVRDLDFAARPPAGMGDVA